LVKSTPLNKPQNQQNYWKFQYFLHFLLLRGKFPQEYFRGFDMETPLFTTSIPNDFLAEFSAK
jgi:hypothetical protein